MNPFLTNKNNEDDENIFVDSNITQLQSHSLNESQITTFDEEYSNQDLCFDSSIDVSATSDVIAAKNPFKV